MLVSDATVFGALILVLIHQLVELEEDGGEDGAWDLLPVQPSRVGTY